MTGTLTRHRAEPTPAAALDYLRNTAVVVLALRRSVRPAAAAIARVLEAPLDDVVVTDMPVPGRPDLAMGAVGEDGTVVVNTTVVTDRQISRRRLRAAEAVAATQARREARGLRAGRPPESLDGRTAVLVDDGAATGAALRAACRVVRARRAAGVVVAVPVARPGLGTALDGLADRVVTLRPAARRAGIGSSVRPAVAPEVTVDAGGVALAARLVRPPGARALVVVAGEGDGGPPDGRLAAALARIRIGALLLSLHTGARRSDVDVLTARLLAVLDRAGDLADGLPVGLFGTARAATAALYAAPAADLFALVARGARPDPRRDGLDRIQAPALLIVGGLDPVSLERTMRTRERLRCPNRLAVQPGAGHLFEEPGPAAAAADLAAAWFADHLAPSSSTGIDRKGRTP